MSATAWNSAEEEALQGLPLAAQVLYLRGLRRYMDYSTGLVGVRRRVSWQQLSETLYVDPHAGLAESGRIGREQVRRLAGWLQRAGLLENRSDERRKQLIFFLPMADRDESAQKQPDRKPTVEKLPQADRKADTSFANRNNDLTEQPDTHPDRNPTVEKKAQADTPPVIRNKRLNTKNTTVDLAGANSTALPVTVVFDYWRSRMDKSRAQLDDKRRRAIAGRLRDGYTVEQVKQAIDGCALSPWHQGQNDRKRPFNDIELICRNGAKLDGFIALAQQAAASEQELAEFLNGDERVIDGECSHVRSKRLF